MVTTDPFRRSTRPVWTAGRLQSIWSEVKFD
jgi:hypothetical protein